MGNELRLQTLMPSIFDVVFERVRQRASLGMPRVTMTAKDAINSMASFAFF